MVLIRCGCGHQLSKQAMHCPSCGAPGPGQRRAERKQQFQQRMARRAEVEQGKRDRQQAAIEDAENHLQQLQRQGQRLSSALQRLLNEVEQLEQRQAEFKQQIFSDKQRLERKQATIDQLKQLGEQPAQVLIMQDNLDDKLEEYQGAIGYYKQRQQRLNERSEKLLQLSEQAEQLHQQIAQAEQQLQRQRLS